MGKNKNKKSKNQTVAESKQVKKIEEDRVTMKDLEEMSDSDDEQIPESQWSTKAKNLRQEIESGKFDKILGALKKAKDQGGNDEEFEEDTLDSSDDDEKASSTDEDGAAAKDAANESGSKESEEEEDDEDGSGGEGSESENDEEEEKPTKDATSPNAMEANEDGRADEEDNESEEDQDDESEEEGNEDPEDEEMDETDEKAERLAKNNQTNSKALAVVTAELTASHANLPWAETFYVIPPTPLPFGEKLSEDTEKVNIHDDLKREVTFYNTALEAVHEARARCKKAGIPFTRPEDFFAEMVKTDDHMAKVKDRLIFETKKMDAVAQRKSNKEQKLRAKESHANKLAEKAKRKREHFQEVEEWANAAARNRGGALRDDADEMFLNKGPNKKREAANRKYGFGGKKGRFKQNDKATINDVSKFNPRGNFPGMGSKKTAKGRSTSGAARPGKRARDSKRART